MSSIAKPQRRSLGTLIGGAAYGRAFRRIEPALDTDAAKYLAAVEAADKQVLEDGVKRAVSKFVRACKTDGNWDAIKASCILCNARTLAGALVPLKGAAPTKQGTEGGWDYNRETGLQGDGASNYLDSNRNNNADPQDSNHLSFYASVTGSSNTGYMASGAGSSVGINQIYVSTAPSLITRSRSSSASTGFTHSAGFSGISRSSSNSYTVRANSANNEVTIGSQTPNNANIIIFNVPSLPYHSDARLSFYSIGEAVDLALLDTAVSTLVSEIGAAV